jgi:hypothetical protein
MTSNSFDIAKWVAVNVPLENQVDSSDGLAVATGGAKEAAVTVQLAEEGDKSRNEGWSGDLKRPTIERSIFPRPFRRRPISIF